MRRARCEPPLADPLAALLVVLALAVASAAPGHRASARGRPHRSLGGPVPARCLGADPQELLLSLTSAEVYNRLYHPGAESGTPTRLEQQIYVEKLVGVDQTAQTVTIAGYWRSAWLDERLAFAEEWGDCFDHLDLHLDNNLEGPPQQDPLLIWAPSLFFQNVLTESYSTYSFRVMPSGRVFRSIQILHKFSCAMDFGRMPFDTQKCPVTIMPYDEPASSVIIVPMASGSFVDGTRGGDDDGPIKVQTTLWDAVDFASAVSQEGYTVGDESLMYDALTINFILQRKSGFSVRRDVAYAVLFVFMSYVGFFVDSKAAPARAALAVIPVLTMLNHLNSVERSLPPLSSSTWLTSFLMLSLVYTAIAVLELAVISATLGIERRRAGRMATFEKLAKRMQDVSNPLNDRERKLFQTFFKTIDSGGLLCDSDGTISVTELKAGLRHFNIYYSLEQCSDVIELVRSQHASVSGLRRPSLSGGAQEDFDVPPAPAAQPRVARAPWESPPAPSAPAAPPSPGDTEFALVAAAPHHAHTLVAAAGASATAVGAAAQSHQQSQRKSLASSGAATMCPVFPRALGCFGSSMPRPESSQETPLSIRQQAHQPQLHVDPGLQKQQVPRDVGPSSCAHQSSSGHSISNLEFRTLLIMFENGSIHPTPPCVTKFFDQRPSDIIDGLARYLFFSTYLLCILIMIPTIAAYPSSADQ